MSFRTEAQLIWIYPNMPERARPDQIDKVIFMPAYKISSHQHDAKNTQDY